ncbi:MAG: Lrp/AsnC ligand binding domain-containing protein [Candidatus Thermoplasmatota archaeon]
MVAIGFVLIDTKPTMERSVYEALSRLREIKELYLLFGGHDIIARIEGEDFNEIGQVIVGKVRRVGGVEDTRTLTVIEL